MSILLGALVLVASAVLVAEFGLAAAAGLVGYRPGIERFANLTGITLRPGLYRGMGFLALAGVAGIIVGFWRPGFAVVAASYFSLLSAFTIARQLQRGQRGQELMAYALFLVSAAIVVVIRAASWAGVMW